MSTEGIDEKDIDGIWYHFPEPVLHGDVSKIRVMEKLETPPFKSPVLSRKFMRGNQECRCVCETKYLPRNAILIRPHDRKKAEPIYELMEKAWRLGRLKWLSHGSCQQFLKTDELKREFHYVLQYASMSCVDNVDNGGLKPGDILLTRHGEELVGKPHLILERKKDG